MSIPAHPQYLYAIYQQDPTSKEWMLLMTTPDRATKDRSMEFYAMGHTLYCITYAVVDPGSELAQPLTRSVDQMGPEGDHL